MSRMVVLGQMLVLLGMMGIGYYLYKKKRVTEAASRQISGLVVNVCNPILIVNGVLGKSAADGMERIWLNLMMVAVFFLIVIGAGKVMPLLLRTSGEEKGICALMTSFPNMGFMGIPVITGIFGSEAMIYVAFYLLAYNILLYTYGMQMAQKVAGAGDPRQAASKRGFGEILKKICNPGVIASLVAVVIFAVGLPVPDPVMTFCDYMGNTTIPLSMLLIGISVAQADLKDVFSDIRIYLFIVIRMILLPVGLIFLLRPVVSDPLILGIFIVEMGMPVGSIVSMLIKESGVDSAYSTRGVVLSTLASIVTIPLICMFL